MQKQGIELKQGLNEEELAAIRELADVCEMHDGIRLKLNWDMLRGRPQGVTNDLLYYENGKLAAFLGMYVLIPTEAELSGMVHPACRRRGIFTEMVGAALSELQGRGPKDAIYICSRDSASGHAFLRQRGLPYSFSEYVMERDEVGLTASPASLPVDLKLRQAGAEDAKLLGELNRVGFGMTEQEADGFAAAALSPNELTYVAEIGGRAVGKISVLNEGGTAFIYGFSVRPEERGRGIGRSILAGTIERVEREQGATRCRLEVAADNERALGLYKSCGFHVVSVIDYYKEPLSAYS